MVKQVPGRVTFEQSRSIRTNLIEKVDSAKGLVARVPVDLDVTLTERRVYILVSGNGEAFGYLVDDRHPGGNFTHRYSQRSVDSAIDPNMLAGLGADVGLTLRDRICEAIDSNLGMFFSKGGAGKMYDLPTVLYGEKAYRESRLRVMPLARNDTGCIEVPILPIVDHLSRMGFIPVERRWLGLEKDMLLAGYEEELDERVFRRDRLPVEEFGNGYKPVERVSLFG